MKRTWGEERRRRKKKRESERIGRRSDDRKVRMPQTRRGSKEKQRNGAIAGEEKKNRVFLW